MRQNDPHAYLPGDRRRALAAGHPLAEYTHGSAVFADISGYTSLGEALAAELGPHRGAEELTAAVNAVFGPLLTTLARYGGEVIYFSGDAVTAWIDGDDGRLAVACAQQIQDMMPTVGALQTAARQPVRLGVKVAVVVGPARRFVVGDPSIQRIDVLAGRLIDRLAAAEHAAAAGQVVVGADVLASIGDLVDVAPIEGHPDVAVLLGLREAVREPAPRPPLPSLPDEVVREWVLPRVMERISSGHGELFAELRSGVPLFMRFGGIDYDAEDGAATRLADFVATAQRAVDRYGGAIVQLTIGDKGAYVYAAFGALVAHEDDAARACACALELLEIAETFSLTGTAIGITAGGLHTGTYGHPDRRAFCCFGDAVNLAARLMSAAPVGGVLVAGDVRRDAGSGFDWGESQPLTVKGKSAPVIVCALLGRASESGAAEVAALSPLVGRERELGRLRALAAAALDGRGHMVVLTGPGGVGKNRLMRELSFWLYGRGARVWSSTARFYGTRPVYGVWQDLCRSAWNIDRGATQAVITARLRSLLADVDPALLDRLPLLGPLVGATIADTELTATFDAKLRKESLESLMVQVIAHRAARAPVAYLVDSAESLDELSWDLFAALRRAITHLPVLVVIARRPEDPVPFVGRPGVTDLAVEELDEQARARLIEARLSGGGAHAVPPALVERLTALAGGNPYHLEELANLLVERGVDLTSDTEVALPTSLQSLQLARIDTLTEVSRRTLKVASVVGTRFATAAVAGSYPELGDAVEVGRYALALVDAALVVPEHDDLAEFAFRNAMIHQTAYETLPYQWRGTLHDRVLDWLERTIAPEVVAANLDVLAFHATRGTDLDKRRDYLIRAGASAQAGYANEAAVAYFRDALPLVGPDERLELYRRLGKVLEILGRWSAAEDAYQQCYAICEASANVGGRARAQVDLAEVNRKQARYEQARALLDDAYAAFEKLDDPDGTASVLHLRGTIASQQGDYDTARAAYNESLAIRRELDDHPKIGALLSNLAIVAEQLENFDAARKLNEQALAVREQVGDPWAIAVSHNNLGMIALLQNDFARATSHIAASIRLAERVGDRWIVAVGHHNNGNAQRGLGQFAAAVDEFEAAWQTYDEYDDRWSQALLLEDVVLLAAAAGMQVEAHALVAAADAVRTEIDTPRPPAVASQLEAVLSPRPVGPADAPPNGHFNIFRLFRTLRETPSG